MSTAVTVKTKSKQGNQKGLFEDTENLERWNAWGGALVVSLLAAGFFLAALFWPMGGERSCDAASDRTACEAASADKHAADIAKELREVVLSASAQIALFSLFIAVFQRTNFSRIVKGSLAMSLGGSADLFRQLDDKVRRKFVKANLVASLDEKTGGAVFENVVGPLMGSTTSYRENFRYIVTALEAAPAKTGAQQAGLQALIAALHDAKTYFWMNQSVQYDLRKAVNDEMKPHSGPFELRFSFDEKTLDADMRDDRLYFREVLKLAEADYKLLAQLKPDELKAFPKQVLNLKVETRNSGIDVDCEFDVEVVAGPPPRLHVLVKEIRSPKNSAGLKVSFDMPQLREITRFVVALPQPTENPEIEFTRASSMKNLEPVRFLSRLKGDAVTETVNGVKVDKDNPAASDPAIFNLKIDGWTFPTSGVVFVWENR